MESPVLLTRLLFLSGMLAAAATPSVLAAAPANDISIKRLKAYNIVVPDSATDVEQHAAQVLQQHIATLTGTPPAIRKEAAHGHAPAIFLGRTHAAERTATAQLNEDGYAFAPVANGLVVAGGSGNGVLYGVYQLLEHWGFRLYASKGHAARFNLT